ncbi:MAG: hypothetical protein ACXWM7_08035, partial [Parachlamydiaceae bacterium]
KSWNFDKEAAQNFLSGTSGHCLWQGTSEDKILMQGRRRQKPTFESRSVYLKRMTLAIGSAKSQWLPSSTI